MKTRIIIACCLCAAAYLINTAARTPEVKPNNPVAINIGPLLQGDTAASDCALIAAMCEEVAEVIEWDGMQDDPLLSTGTALDAFRTRTRRFLCRGESIGDRQPAVRDAVAGYLDEELGSDGGEISQVQRAKWVRAYKEIAESARNAIQ